MKNILALLTSVIALFSLSIPMFAPMAVNAQTTSGSFCYAFNVNLGEGRAISAANADALQQALSAQGFWNASTPITSYTDAVASAVSGFQEKYAAQILTPNGLSYGTGYVGVSTRAELNTLYGCSTSTSTSTGGQTFQCPSGWVCTAPTQQAPVTYTCPVGWTCTPTNAVTPITTNNPSCTTGGYSYCITQTPTSPYSPTLSYVSPAQSSANQIVTLAGSNFSDSTEIHFSNSAGVHYSFAPSSVSPSGDSMTFSVPASLDQGTYSVTVYNITSSDETSNSLAFTIGAATTVVNQTPYTGLVSASLSLDGSSPLTQTVSVTNTIAGQYLGLPVLVFDVNSQGDTLHLHQVSVNLTASGSGSVTAAYLYQGSTPIASAAVSNGIATFQNINDGQAGASIPVNTEVPFTIKADVSGVTAGNSESVTASLSASSQTIYSSIDSLASVSGSANGYTQMVVNGNTGPVNSQSSATISLDGSSPLTQSVSVTNAIAGQYLGLPVLVFDVNSQGDTLHLHNVAVNVSSSGIGSVNAAYLYQGSTPIASASVVNGIATFANISDGAAGAAIPINTTLPFTVKVDVSGVTASSASEAVTASLSSTNMVVENSIDAAVPVSGSATGYIQTVMQ